MEKLLPSKFEFSLFTDSKLCNTLQYGEETVHYLDSLYIGYYRGHYSTRKCHRLKICNKQELAKKEQLLIHFKLRFDAEKYRTNEQATINQWKVLHVPPDNSQFQFITFKNNGKNVKELPRGENRLPNTATFLWDCSQLSTESDEKSMIDFEVYFGFYSTQFPILNNNHYVGSLFDLLVEIYSVESKRKLDSSSFKLKISREYNSQYNTDLASQEKTQIHASKKDVYIENDNLTELLDSLSIQTLPPVNPLPSNEQINQIQLGRAFFKYEIAESCSDQYTLPVVYIKFRIWYKTEKKLNSRIKIDGSNFKYANEGKLVKTVFTLGLNRQFETNEWLQNWQRVNEGKRLLQYFFDYDNRFNCRDDELFDIYSSDVNQFCLIWMPSKPRSNFSIDFNVCDDNELDYHKFECYLKAETFRYDDNNNDKIDEAICRIEFNKTCPDNGLTVHKSCILKNEAKYFVKKVVFITVDGSDYTPMSLQQSQQSDVDQFKENLISLIQRVKNIDRFQIGALRYFAFGQTDDDQENDFYWTTLNSLEAKAALKCVMRKVNNKEFSDQEIRYDIDLINQQ